MRENPLKELNRIGQSVWLDYIRRDLIADGQLQRFIENDGVSGITSNPSIFEKAIAESNLYNADIHQIAIATKDNNLIYEAVSQQDVQNAADLFRPQYEKSDGRDGYVSLEVNPHLAYDTLGTIEEGSRLWDALNRPNVLIKVPATAEGLPAIRQLISDGINVNVTLIFSLQRYKEVADAFTAGIRNRILMGKSPKKIVSVASLFLSRIDNEIDPKEADFAVYGGKQSHFSSIIKGQVAVSIAKMAYKTYREIFENDEFTKLGALPQRLLWASVSPKNPNYYELKYIESLIGPNTIITIPLKTLNAFRDHGDSTALLETNLKDAFRVLSELIQIGIDLEVIARKLENDGVEKFILDFDMMLEVLSKKILTC